MAAGDDEADGWEFGSGAGGAVGFEEDGVDVAFEMIDGDERFVQRGGEGFSVGDADEEGADEAWALGDGDGVEVGEAELACARAWRTTGTIWRRCSREASSGTTPPYFWWISICEATTLERTSRPSETMAAAVSSQEDSMARILVVM